MRRPSRDSRTTEQKSPVVRDICSAMMASRASISGTASLNAADAAAIAAMRLDSSPDTRQLYYGVNRHEPLLSDEFARHRSAPVIEPSRSPVTDQERWRVQQSRRLMPSAGFAGPLARVLSPVVWTVS